MRPFNVLMPMEFRSLSNFSSHTTPRKKVLFLTYRFPYPLSGGDRLKSYHLLRHLSEIADVDLISIDEWNSGHGENLEHIKLFAKNVTVVPFSRAAAWARVLFTLPTQTPVEYGWYDVPAMQEAVDSALGNNLYDLIVCFFVRTAIYVKDVKGTPKLLVAEDSRLLMQERSSEKFSFTGEYFIRNNDAKKLRRYEPQMFRHFDLVTFVAKPDQNMVRALDPALNTAILTNGIDIRSYHYSEDAREDALLFAGVLSVYHNKRMAQRIMRNVYPLVKDKQPCSLIIVGKSPERDLVEMANEIRGVELHGDVVDTKLFYKSAKVFVHPQDTGAGIQNKLLEALALGCAVVTTSVGAAGIEGLIDGVNCLVRNTDQEMASACAELLRDEEKRLRLTRAGRALIEERYTWDTIFDQFDQVIGSLVPNFFHSNELMQAA
jgi:glycosyltransferase involved in cell wall biosynthesis